MTRLLTSALALSGLIAAAATPAQPVTHDDFLRIELDGRSRIGEHFAVIPRDANGNFVGFLYLEDEALLYRADCTASGCTPATPVMGSGRGPHVSAAMRPTFARAPLVAAYDTATADLVISDCTWNSPQCAFGFRERVLDSTGDVGQFSAMTINGSTDQALISYYDAGNGDLKLYVCTNAACSTGQSLVVDAGGDRGRHSAVAFSGGALWIAYDDTTLGSIRLARALAPFDTFSFIDVGSGSDPAIAARNDGGVDLVWTGPQGELRHQRCGDATCSNPQPQALSGEGLGHAPALQRLSNGFLFASHASAAGDLLGTACADDACGPSRTSVTLDAGPGLGQRSVALGRGNALPLAFHLDGDDEVLRVARCNDALCATIEAGLASNGIAVGPPEVVTRPDGRPIVAWYRLAGTIRLALCENIACGRHSLRVISSSGSGERVQPALALRPDGRPMVYYSTGGGTGLWSCSDVLCTSGTSSLVSSPGSLNHTGDVAEIGMRSDGRAVLMYYNKVDHDLYLHLCSDVNCSNGTPRRIVDEASPVMHPTLAIDAQDRPLVSYSVGSAVRKFMRCDDASCTSATGGAYPAPAILGQALAVRSDDRPATVAAVGGTLELGICDTAPCTSAASFPLPASAAPNRLLLAPGDRPLFDVRPAGSAGYLACDDATCSTWSVTTAISDGRATAGFDTALAPGAGPDARPVIAVRTQPDLDALLLIGKGEVVFADSFD